MARRSAGLLLYRDDGDLLRVLLVHPGGPFWRNKDVGAWSIPKGEYGEGEDPRAAALREFAEETGTDLGEAVSALIPLGDIRQAGGKVVTAFALAGDIDAAAISSNSFEMEWPPKSGRRQAFPEVDRAAWFTLAEAAEKIIPGQRPLLDRLTEHLRGAPPASPRRPGRI